MFICGANLCVQLCKHNCRISLQQPLEDSMSTSHYDMVGSFDCAVENQPEKVWKYLCCVSYYTPQYKRHSIFEVDASLKAEFDKSYFNNNEMIVNDVSFGQRNYKRNLDGILDVLVKPRQNLKDPKKFKQQEL